MLPARSAPHLPLQEVTLAELLQQAGYLTALVGKWHLGDAAHAPESQGFDINIGGTHWGAPQTFFFPYRGNKRFDEFRYVPHLEFGQPGEYLTDRLTDEGIRVIDHAAAQKQPFFLFLSHHAPHTPIEAKEVDVSYFAAQRKPRYKHQNPAYAAMIRSLDTSVGRIVSRLNELDLTNDTILIFTSDNGGYLGHDAAQNLPITSNAPLRSGKGTLYEGGLRVPFIIRWPKSIDAVENCDQPIVLTDLFPTLAAAAGIDVSKNQPCDGFNRLPLLKDPLSPQARQTLYFHYPHYYHAPPSTPASALRSGPWKLIEYYETRRVELYNLESDPGEQDDVAARLPEQVSSLQLHLRQWLTSVNAQLPTANPNYRSE
jgi:arylsulfatase A-like enzyme